MYYTGFADEAAADLATQIRATKELGWDAIESRNIDGKNIHEISDEAFDTVCAQLEEAGVRINCFGSTIANWAKNVSDPFEQTLAEVERAIPRMQRLGTPMIRIMSYKIMRDRAPDDQEEAERFRRVGEIVARFRDAGLVPVHENCMNYGGMGWQYTLKLLDAVPDLCLVFDTANPLNTPDYSKPEPRPRQSTWEFYSHVREHIEYVHIKDSVFVEDTGGIFPKATFTYPGEGDGDVERVVRDLLANGYDGGFSMEPHLDVVFHESESGSAAEKKYASYVEYGRRFMALMDAIRADG